MSNFLIEYQNKNTNWDWELGKLLADDDGMGISFNDDFVVPDITPAYPFYTWTNFRILCSGVCDKVDVWAKEHDYPDQLDQLGRTHQSGDPISTYSDYQSLSLVFKDSNRFYFWVKGTNQDENYVMTQTVYDSLMATKSVSYDPSIEPSYDIENVASWLGWNPVTQPMGGAYAFNAYQADLKTAARWIMGWDNACMQCVSRVRNPSLTSQFHVGCIDTFSMIEGMAGKVWLGCEAGKYIYGKIVYALEDHDFVNHKILQTSGFKSCQINIGALQYG